MDQILEGRVFSTKATDNQCVLLHDQVSMKPFSILV
jgi:hypothetical protein